MQCGKGFGLDTKNSLLCTMNGTWIGSPAKCLRRKKSITDLKIFSFGCRTECRAIPAANGRLTGQCTPTGLQNKSCSLRCNPGFQLNGPRSVLCGANGLWQPTLPRCLSESLDFVKKLSINSKIIILKQDKPVDELDIELTPIL